MEEISNTLHSKRKQQSSQTEHEPHKMRRASPEFRPDNPTRHLRTGSNFCRRVHLNQRKQRALVTGFPATLLTSSAYQENLWLFLITFWVLIMHQSIQICITMCYPNT